MKLICETIEEVSVLKESREDGKKDVYIQGPFLMGEDKNRNGRVYPIKVLAKEVARYNEQYIDKNRAFGELGHPSGPSINLDRVSHIITQLEQRGNHFYGKAKLTETPMGNIAKGILESGGKLGVSSRGMGSVVPDRNGTMIVGDDFMLATAADIVADPSAHIAFVEAVMENTDWIYDAASGNWLALEQLDKTKKQVHASSASQISENSVHLFERFLNTLVSK
jgi:hypothetical protein